MTKKIFFSILILLSTVNSSTAQALFQMSEGKISFTSDAPLELIKAETTTFQFILDTLKQEFAISIPITGFVGFNSPLQQEHFYENYMETGDFPKATFTGKLLNGISYRTGPFTVSVKGTLDLHGQKQQRIIDVTCAWQSPTVLNISSNFEIELIKHDIEIPKVVYQKIADVIRVKIEAELRERK